METILFLDLDNTIFRTARRAKGDLGNPIAYDASGSPISYMSDKQSAVLCQIRNGARVIPVTARTTSALKLVDIQFDDYAICSYGGVILSADGNPDIAWNSKIRKQSQENYPRLLGIKKQVEAKCTDISVNIETRIVNDLDMNLYASARHTGKDETMITRLFESLKPELPKGFWIHMNGNELSVIPDYVNKKAAVSHIIDHHLSPKTLKIGFADSISDCGFLGLCDFILIPNESQIGTVIKNMTL